MTLLDAPKFDAARDRRNQIIIFGSAGLFVVLFVASWFVAGMPVDFPWNWWAHFIGRSTASHFLSAVEQNDLGKAYGIWTHDPDWKSHPQQHAAYPFARFQQDWSPTSSGNDYGAIKSHKILAARLSGNVLIMGIRVNDLKSNALFLNYEPRTHQLGFSPVQLYLGP
ncbi:MAG TPA: hypothetical protein VE291_04950 [Terracidiphilus sp.]|jgi:hypothetical protein|nr:hypothetical protein [Terracidiphilus sp.]